MKIPTLTAQQMAKVDRLMIEEYGILLDQMMENAGRNLAELARRMLGGKIAGRRVVVLCGSGNNGGGGMVAARHLFNWGSHVQIKIVVTLIRLKGTPAHQWKILEAMGFESTREPELAEADLIVDALIGYGLVGAPRNPQAVWIERVNASNRPVLALDTPSGLNVTNGNPGNPCIRAAATLTLALPKTGLLAAQARPYVGDLYLADISVPTGLYRHLGLEVGNLFVDDTILKLSGSRY
jgi:NAD(P)H-hydrate epimerase